MQQLNQQKERLQRLVSDTKSDAAHGEALVRDKFGNIRALLEALESASLRHLQQHSLEVIGQVQQRWRSIDIQIVRGALHHRCNCLLLRSAYCGCIRSCCFPVAKLQAG